MYIYIYIYISELTAKLQKIFCSFAKNRLFLIYHRRNIVHNIRDLKYAYSGSKCAHLVYHLTARSRRTKQLQMRSNWKDGRPAQHRSVDFILVLFYDMASMIIFCVHIILIIFILNRCLRAVIILCTVFKNVHSKCRIAHILINVYISKILFTINSL